MTVNRVTRTDRILLSGAVLMGLAVTSPIGLVLVFYGMYLESQERKAGRAVRPAVITALAVWGIANGLVNLFSAHGMLFAYDNAFFMPTVKVYGIHIDQRYWGYGYNTAWWGGVADPYETTWNVMTGFFLFPIYTVANYGLFRMKRWGYIWTLITSWIFAYAWMHYLCNHTLNGNENILSAIHPIWGWMVMNYPYLTPFFAILILHVANREAFEVDTPVAA